MKQLGLDFTEIRIPLYTPQSSAEIHQYSPSGKVPALIVNDSSHGSVTIWDSLAICEYLAETFPAGQLWPQSPTDRAHARSISAEMHSGFQALRTHLSMDIRASYPDQNRAPGVEADIERITTIWTTCRQQFSSDGSFLFGSFTIADALYAPVVTRFQTYHVALDPVCQQYAETILGMPAMQDWIRDGKAETETIQW